MQFAGMECHSYEWHRRGPGNGAIIFGGRASRAGFGIAMVKVVAWDDVDEKR